tara:strand:- start:12960 stop:13283 length:324 start_codon:yes stop_codon:yes gene_type:complete
MTRLENGRKFWALVVSVVGAAAVVIVFMFNLVSEHVSTAHAMLYKPQYPGDTVNRALAELKVHTDDTLREDGVDTEKRHARLEAKIDDILSAVHKLTTEVAVLKARK